MKIKGLKFAVFLLLCILLILSACSSDPANDASEEIRKDSSETYITNKVTLQGVFLDATWGSAAQELAKEYEKETGVKVNIELVDRDVIYQKLALSIAGQANYDLFNIDFNWVPEFALTDSLYPLNDLIKKYNVDTSQYLPRALALTQWNGPNGSLDQEGTIYGLPQTIHPHLLWYRSDLFNNETYKKEFKATYGYELTPPKTMKEFHNAAEFFNGKIVNGQKIYGWAAQAKKGFGNVHTWLSFLYSNGGDVIDWNTMTSTLNSPEAIEATKTWIDLLKFSPPEINDYSFNEVTADAAAGKIAMAIHWSWSAFELDDASKSKTVGKWDFAPFPKMKDSLHSVPHIAGWAIAIPRSSYYSEEAFKFMSWLENKRNDVRQANMGGGDPVRLESYEDPALTEQWIQGTDVKKYRRYDAVQESMENAKARPYFTLVQKWESTVSEYLNAAQLKQLSVQDALKKADIAINKLLK